MVTTMLQPMNPVSKGLCISKIMVKGICTTPVLFTHRASCKNLWTFIEHTIPQNLGYLFFRQKSIRISRTHKGIVPLRDRNSTSKK